MQRTFSLYGLTSNSSSKKCFIEPPTNLKKLANLDNFVPGQAANKYYDKHIIQAIDKFT